MMVEQTAGKSISDTQFSHIWGGLSHNQQRYAIAMLECPSKKEGALAIGVEPDTVYRWPAEIDLVIEYMRAEARDAAVGILEGVVVKAAAIKKKGLDSNDEKIRLDTSSEILDRIIGRATQRQEVDVTSGGKPIRMLVGGIDLANGI